MTKPCILAMPSPLRLVSLISTSYSFPSSTGFENDLPPKPLLSKLRSFSPHLLPSKLFDNGQPAVSSDVELSLASKRRNITVLNLDGIIYRDFIDLIVP